MLSAGFKFICCSTEDDADNPKITWHENLLGMENLQVRQQEINNQVTMTFLAANNDHTNDILRPDHRRNKSLQSLTKNPLPSKKYSLVSSLYALSKSSGLKVNDFLDLN